MDETDLAETLLDQLAQELADGDPLFAELDAFAREAFVAQAELEATWGERALHDAIDDAFADLARRGIGSSFGVRYMEHEPLGFLDGPEGERGCVLWLRDDLMNGIAAARLCVQSATHELAALEREVAFVLAHHGVATTRTKDPAWPLSIPPFAWRKRRTTKAPLGAGPAPLAVPPPPAPPPKCARCGGRGWVTPEDPSTIPSPCACKR
jgi:hypothetical protein